MLGGSDAAKNDEPRTISGYYKMYKWYIVTTVIGAIDGCALLKCSRERIMPRKIIGTPPGLVTIGERKKTTGARERTAEK